MDVVARRFDVFLVNLDRAQGSLIKNARPCAVISPDEMNEHIATVIVAPMTTKTCAYPSRVACRLQGKRGEVAIDQLRTVDKTRLVKKLGRLNPGTAQEVLAVLAELFHE